MRLSAKYFENTKISMKDGWMDGWEMMCMATNPVAMLPVCGGTDEYVIGSPNCKKALIRFESVKHK